MNRNNTDKLTEYLLDGCNPNKRVGIELEHFVCNNDYEPISYKEMEVGLKKYHEKFGGICHIEKGFLLGLEYPEYTLSLEPGCQLEISIAPQTEFAEMERIYLAFEAGFEDVLGKDGWKLIRKGVFPLVEDGEISPKELPLIPKMRYAFMDRYFETSGEHGRYMMRATASTQLSFDYSSEEDAMRKMRVLEKLAPIIALLTEQRCGLGTGKEWKNHLLRTQIWNDVDRDRCGYFPGSVSSAYSFEKYADYICHKPCILMQKGEDCEELGKMSADEYFCEAELDVPEHVLSMFFPTVRLKHYLEFRVADSMEIQKVTGFAVLMSSLLYREKKLEKLEQVLLEIDTEEEILEAEKELEEYGYKAIVYGKPVMEWMEYLLYLGIEGETDDLVKRIRQLENLNIKNYLYRKNVVGHEKEHKESARAIRDYLSHSTAKYHNRVIWTLYIPKLFTKTETKRFEEDIIILYGIFDKVMDAYEKDPSYRKFFGFPRELEELILREKKYGCNIPMARVDVFYREDTGDYKYCEFNTDGSSAMNEDRELNIAFQKSEAYQMFQKDNRLGSYELFDTWVDEAITLYQEFCGDSKALPNLVITDFMEHATENEFVIFKEHFEKKGVRTEICDITELHWDGKKLYTKSGMPVDAVYRRAVTSDIMEEYDKVQDFIHAVKSDTVCVLGDFRTQIVHNKLLFEILHLPQTMELLSRGEQIFVRAHVPLTVSHTSDLKTNRKELWENVLENKDNWILKPEDSYGSLGIHAGVESKNRKQWEKIVESCLDKHYILQEFYQPYRLSNIDLIEKKPEWIEASNLTGIFVYGGKYAGLYSRTSFDAMISTQYNEMSLPSILVEE